MPELRQAVLGIVAALIACGFVIGALTLSLAERDLVVARALATEPPAQVYPSPVIFVDTPAPGEPTFTPSPSPEPSLTPGPPSKTPNCIYPAGWTAITVQPGDTLDTLAQAFGISVDALSSGNCLPVNLLMPGMTLFVPPLPTATATLPPTETLAPSTTATAHNTCDQPPTGWLAYTVQWGDTLAALSQSTGASVPQLKKANCLKSDRINAGQRLWVPRLPPATAIPYRTPTRIPTLPPSATVPPPTSPPPTQPLPPTAVPPTVVPPTPIPPTTAPSDTPVPTTEVPTEIPIPPTAVPSPTVAPTVVTTTEMPVPTTEAPSDRAATPTPPAEAPTISPTTLESNQTALFGVTYSTFSFCSRSVIIHPDGTTKTAPAATTSHIDNL